MSANDFTINKLLLHFDGANNSTTFTEETGRVVTPVGTAKISTTQSKFGGAAAYFDGSSGYLTVPATGIGFYNDFTVRTWVYMTAAGSFHGVLEGRAVGGYNFLFGIYNVSGTLRIDHVNDGGASKRLTGTSTSIALNTWTCLEWVRANGTLMGFVGGVKDATTIAYASPIIPTASTLQIGHIIDPGFFSGYMDELEIIDGVALHTENFTPPTAPSTLWTYSHRASGLILPRHNSDYNGLGTLTGTTRVQTGPTTFTIVPNCKVLVFDRTTNRPIRETTSDASGNYTVSGLNPAGSYLGMAIDPTGTYDLTASRNQQVTP